MAPKRTAVVSSCLLALLAVGWLVAASCGGRVSAAAQPERAAAADSGAARRASIDLPAGAVPEGVSATLDESAGLPLFPDVTVVRATPSVQLAVPASIRVPYDDALLASWGVDESHLVLYGLDNDGLWAWVPATIVANENVAVAQVTRLTSWAVMPGGLMSAWQARGIVGPAFEPGKHNLLLVHGWNSSPWDGCMLALAAAMAPSYDHVASYAYPSALDIHGNAAWLRDRVAEQAPGTTFDIIGFSEGGLIARAAIEPGAGNGGRTIAPSVRSLVTIATPHNGLAPDAPHSLLGDEASLQMRAGSMFLSALNTQPRHDGVRYYTVAGSGGPSGASDMLVPVRSALGADVVAFDGTATLPLLHAPSRDGFVSGMPCDPMVYDVVRGWLAR